jgi:hypothetical protein
MFQHSETGNVAFVDSPEQAEKFGKENPRWSVTPLCTAPPKREWVGLTAEEVWECYKENGNKLFYLAIEAKLKEKNT